MPGRITPLITDQIYHVFNRGINHQPTFIHNTDYNRAKIAINFYKHKNPPTRLSKFLKLSNDQRQEIIINLQKDNDCLVKIYAFCLMPNHFHFLLKQFTDGGISKFLANFQNSYTKFFNIRKERDGSLFLDQFKAVFIDTDEQFLHVSRYIHLNPYSSFVVRDIQALFKYPHSSLPEYISNQPNICEIKLLSSFFNKTESHMDFVKDQADYQRKLHFIQHLIFE